MYNTGSKRETCTIQEKREFSWKIENFLATVASATNSKLKNAGCVFEAGHSIGLPTSWKLYLKKQENDMMINMELLESPEGIQKVTAKFEYKTRIFYADKYAPREYSANDGMSDAFFTLNNFEVDDLENASLVISIKFSVFKDVSMSGQNKRIKFEHESREAAAADFQKLMDSGKDADVTLEMPDGQTLKAHSVILKTRSRVFAKMIHAQMQKSSSGIIRIEDVSYQAMKIILAFIYTGKVDENWEEVIEEIVLASKKYELILLKGFCDENLATTCTPQNTINLLNFAKRHGLKKAEGDIAEYYEIHVKEIIQAQRSS